MLTHWKGDSLDKAKNVKYWLKSDHTVVFCNKKEMYEDWISRTGNVNTFIQFNKELWKNLYEKF